MPTELAVGQLGIAKDMLCMVEDWNGAMWGVKFLFDPRWNMLLTNVYWSNNVGYLNAEDIVCFAWAA